MKPLFLLGEARGENEAKINSSFVGASGIELLRMLHESGCIQLTSADYDYLNRYYREGKAELIDMIWRLHPEVYRSNVFQMRPPGNKLEWFCGGKREGLLGYPALIKGKYVRAEYKAELERLGDEVVSIDPNLVVCLANCALWAMAGTTGVSKLRGTTSLSSHTATGYKLLSTYHPSAVLRQWELRPVVVMDLTKAARETNYPDIRRPRREIWIAPSLIDIDLFHQKYIIGCKMLSVDIENPGGPISCVGLAPSPQQGIVIPFSKGRAHYWKVAADEVKAVLYLKGVLEDPAIKKVFQNCLYDVAVLYRYWGIKVMGFEEDTLLLHHALQPESLKSLGFMGSIYTDEGPWKSDHRHGTIKRDS